MKKKKFLIIAIWVCSLALLSIFLQALFMSENSVWYYCLVGDFVLYNDQPGIVYSIGIRTTRLKWFGEVLSIRNNDFKDYISYPTGEKDLLTVSLLPWSSSAKARTDTEWFSCLTVN